MDDRLHDELNRLAPEVDTAAASELFQGRRSRRRRRAWVVRGAALVAVTAAAAFGLAQLGADNEPTPLAVSSDDGSTPTSTAAPSTTAAVHRELPWRSFDVDGVEVHVRTALDELPEQASVVELSRWLSPLLPGQSCTGRIGLSIPPVCFGLVIEESESPGSTNPRTVQTNWPPVEGRIQAISERPFEQPPGDTFRAYDFVPYSEVAGTAAEVEALVDQTEPPYVTGLSVPGFVYVDVLVADRETVRAIAQAVSQPEQLVIVGSTAIVAGQPGEPAPPAPLPQLLVTQVKTNDQMFYIEGSIGLMEILDDTGERVGPITTASEVSGDTEPFSVPNTWDAVTLVPGTYTVSVWQLPGNGPPPSQAYDDWEASAAAGDRRPELCTTSLTVALGDVVELEATWAPGEGCVFARL